MTPRADGPGDVERRVLNRQELGGAMSHENRRSLLVVTVRHADARVRENDAMAGPEDERLRWPALPALLLGAEQRRMPTHELPQVHGERRGLRCERVGAGAGSQEKAAGASLVSRDTVPPVVQDRQEELRHRVGPRRHVIRERPQDADGGRIVAAEHRADPVLDRRLRRCWRGEQCQYAHERCTGKKAHRRSRGK